MYFPIFNLSFLHLRYVYYKICSSIYQPHFVCPCKCWLLQFKSVLFCFHYRYQVHCKCYKGWYIVWQGRKCHHYNMTVISSPAELLLTKIYTYWPFTDRHHGLKGQTIYFSQEILAANFNQLIKKTLFFNVLQALLSQFTDKEKIIKSKKLN